MQPHDWCWGFECKKLQGTLLAEPCPSGGRWREGTAAAGCLRSTDYSDFTIHTAIQDLETALRVAFERWEAAPCVEDRSSRRFMQEQV
jgi:hypothetical protein